MNQRKAIKNAHENYVIDCFLKWINANSKHSFVFVEKPDPPDAIIRCKEFESWVEHTDVYRNHEEAREELTTVTPGETPILHSEEIIFEPDAITAHQVLAAIDKKIAKSSYKRVYDEFGAGILLLSERDPLFSESTLHRINDYLKATDFAHVHSYFSRVYLAYRYHTELKFFLLLHDPKDTRW